MGAIVVEAGIVTRIVHYAHIYRGRYGSELKGVRSSGANRTSLNSTVIDN